MAGSVKTAALLLVCTLALTSAQNASIKNGNITSACDVNGRPGTCQEIQDCPESRAILKTRNREAFYAARADCGIINKSGRQFPLLCCPGSAAKFVNHPMCGKSEFNPRRRRRRQLPQIGLNGGHVESLADFPWMALLKWPQDDSWPVYRCAGVVINERWVLTAAQCIIDNGPEAIHVRDLNIHTQAEDNYFEPPADVAVERIIKHPQYRNVIHGLDRGLFSDIALIKLSSPLVFSDILKPLCIPEGKQSIEKGHRAYTTGRGITEYYQGGEGMSQMLWGQVNISDHLACQLSYKNLIQVNDSEHICAVGNLRDARCLPGMGDSGAPLMDVQNKLTDRRWYAIGVVSHGIGHCNPSFPDIYTRVDHFLDWIAETVAGN